MAVRGTTAAAAGGIIPVQSQGAWVPIDGSAGGLLVFSNVSANFTRIGNIVHAYGTVQYPAVGNASSAGIGGFPFLSANQDYGYCPCSLISTVGGLPLQGLIYKNTTVMHINNAATGADVTNTFLQNGIIRFFCSYPVS